MLEFVNFVSCDTTRKDTSAKKLVLSLSLAVGVGEYVKLSM